MISILELRCAKKELVIWTLSEDVAFNIQKELDDLGQDIWLKVVFLIEVIMSDRENKGALIFSKTEF